MATVLLSHPTPSPLAPGTLESMGLCHCQVCWQCLPEAAYCTHSLFPPPALL